MTKILSSKNDTNEWYTPEWIIEKTRKVMGSIDLDPASTPEANKIVRATHIFTIDDDGLNKQWFGNVFLNPPYNGNAAEWSRKFTHEFYSGNIIQGMLLVNANLGYKWFNRLFYDLELMCCLFRERLYFTPADGQKAEKSRRASALFYAGPLNGCDDFRYGFEKYGIVI